MDIRSMHVGPPDVRPQAFNALMGSDLRIKAVDIGANPSDGGPPPYADLLRARNVEVVGFEPHAESYHSLVQAKGPDETYLPYAVADGRRHKFHICQAPSMSSLFRPNPDVLKLFHLFPHIGRVVATKEIDTVRLDDVPETAGTDFIKIDTQGSELMILANAPRRLLDVSVIHTEALFLSMYEGQPLFSDIESFLRRSGFMFHRFHPIENRLLSPFMVDKNLAAGLSQTVWADAVFVRDLSRLDFYSDRQLMAGATVLHDCYGSYDAALLLLTEYDSRHRANLSDKYLSKLQVSFPGRKPRKWRIDVPGGGWVDIDRYHGAKGEFLAIDGS